MNFQYFSFKRYFCAFCVAVPFFMAACGNSGSDSDFEDPSGTDEICEDDFCDSESSDSDGKPAGMSSSSAESSSSFQKKEADISASSYKDSSLVGVKYKSDLGMMNIVNGTIYDSTYNHEYKTVRIGPYEWIAENLLDATTAFENYDMCYDNDRNNCKTDGRLFRDYTKNNMCPTGFVVPSSADYWYLLRVTKNLTDAGLGFNPQMAGFCRRGTFDKDSLGCSDKGKRTYLLTNNDSMFVVGKDGKVRMMESEFYGFYSLRCVRKLSFVENEKQLPICNAETEDDFGDIFVAGAGKNYSCEGGKWIKGSDSDCSWGDRGELHYYGDSLYVCNGSWTLATMNDAGAACIDENDGEVLELNGKKFICKDSSWRELNAVEKSIGLCTAKNIGAIDTIPAKDSLEYYYCDTTGWRFAKIVDYVGKCNDSKFYSVFELNDIKYTCRTDSTWEKFTTLENSIGLCTPKKLGVIDTVKKGESIDPYFCDSTGWRVAKLADYTGACDDTKLNKVINFGSVSYACRSNGAWTKMTAVEQELGICEPKRYNDIDTIDIGVYACDSSGWHTAGVSDYYGKCTELKINTIVDYKGTGYACVEPPTWTQIDNVTKKLGFCTKDIRGIIKDYDGTPYICDSKWRTATQAEFLAECTEENEGSTKKFINTSYGCRNLKWIKFKAVDDSLGFCSKKLLNEIKSTVKKTSYKCLDTGWTKYTPEVAFGKCNDGFRSEHKNEIFKLGDEEYVCWITGWRTPQATLKLEECTAAKVGTFEEYLGDTYYCSPKKNWIEVVGPELEHGLCEDGRTDIVTYNGKKYGCFREAKNYDRIYYNVVEFKWREETELDRAMGFCHSFGMEWKKYNGLDYVCDRDQMGWKNSTFWAMYTACDDRYPYKYGVTVGFKDSLFYCDELVEPITSEYAGWHIITPIDEEKGPCRKDIFEETILFNSREYKCGKTYDRPDSVYRWLPQE